MALILDKTIFTVYIGKTKEGILPDTLTDAKLHFYFGADIDAATAKSHVTVTTLLLYNRPFNEGEVNKLKSNVTTAAHNGKAAQGNTENDETEIKLCFRSMNTITGVLSLFFGVFTSLGRYVY